jgi:hypothetical protein
VLHLIKFQVNPNIEARNAKKIQISKILNSKPMKGKFYKIIRVHHFLAFLTSDLFDDPGDQKGKNKQTDREKHLKR